MCGWAIAEKESLAWCSESLCAAQEALKQVASDSQITPLSVQGDIIGAVKQNETGWHEVKLTIPIHGPTGNGVLHLSGGRENGPWKFTTIEVVMPQLKKKADLVAGRIVVLGWARLRHAPKCYPELPRIVRNCLPKGAPTKHDIQAPFLLDLEGLT